MRSASLLRVVVLVGFPAVIWPAIPADSPIAGCLSPESRVPDSVVVPGVPCLLPETTVFTEDSRGYFCVHNRAAVARPAGNAVGSPTNVALALDGRGWVSLPSEVIERLRACSGPVTIEVCMRWREFRKWSRAWDFGSDAGALFLGNAGVESTLVACCTGIQNDNVFAGSLPLDQWVTIAAVWVGGKQ